MLVRTTVQDFSGKRHFYFDVGWNRHVGVVRMSELHADSLSTPTTYHATLVAL